MPLFLRDPLPLPCFVGSHYHSYEFSAVGRPDKISEEQKRPKPVSADPTAAAASDAGGDGVNESKAGDSGVTSPAEAEPEAVEAEEVHPREYYQYELAGIVIHTGTAQYGYVEDGVYLHICAASAIK
jgi:hypothetical protein